MLCYYIALNPNTLGVIASLSDIYGYKEREEICKKGRRKENY